MNSINKIQYLPTFHSDFTKYANYKHIYHAIRDRIQQVDHTCVPVCTNHHSQFLADALLSHLFVM